MSDNNNQRSWATPAQWESHRELITALYEAHTLNEVMKTMVDEHDFFATVKMYKTHFTKWGLQKNFRSKQVQDLLRQKEARDDVGKATRMYIRGKEVNAEKLSTYIHRKSKRNQAQTRTARSGGGLSPGAQTLIESVVSCRTPSPIPSNNRICQFVGHSRPPSEKQDQDREDVTELIVTQPTRGSTPTEVSLFLLSAADAPKRAEKCMHILQAYVDHNFTSGHWKDTIGRKQQRDIDRCTIWANMSFDAISLLDEGQSQRAFRLLNTCFSQYRSLLSTNCLSLLFDSYRIICRLDLYPELASKFIGYAVEMSETTNGATYPLSLLLAELRIMAYDEIMSDWRPLTDCFNGLIDGYLENKSQLMFEATVQRTSTIVHQCSLGLIDFEVVEAAILKTIATWQSYTGYSSIEARHCRDYLCLLYYNHDRYDGLKLVGSEVLLHDQDPDVLRILALAAEEKGDWHEAIKLAEDSLTSCLERFGSTHYETIQAYDTLQDILRKSGQIARADAVHEQWNQIFNIFCESFEKMTLDGNGDEDESSVGSNDSEASENQINHNGPETREDLLSHSTELESLPTVPGATFCPWPPPVEDPMSWAWDAGSVDGFAVSLSDDFGEIFL